MHKKLSKKLQSAQGMVEFALVLPILLLVILGIIAFGHLFFVYTSVVSSSREAARWGAAVGEAPSTFPRYQDCDSIRAAAVRLGSFAGVNSTDIENEVDTGVEVTYDNGPDTGIYDSCPAGGEGPADVVMGDRIVVRVKVDYTPIVPFVDLPSFPLEATTFRTILRSVPVGEAPTAVDPCTSTTSIEFFADPEPSKVGEDVTYSVRVSADEARVDYPPVGTIDLHDDVTGIPYSCSGTLSDETEHTSVYVCSEPATYYHAGLRTISVRYDSEDTCFLSSNTTEPGPDPTHLVVQADTTIQLGVQPATFLLGSSSPLHVTAIVQSPAGTPPGYVIITFPGQAPMNVPLVNGMASADFIPTSAGTFTITANYPEEADPDYAASTNTINASVVKPTATNAPTPTLVNTPTNTPVPVIPTKTPLPDYCPQLGDSGYDFFGVGSAIEFPIYNPQVAHSTNTNITSVEISWPDSPIAYLQEIRFGSSVGSCDGTNCLFKNADGLGPTHQVVSGSTAGWNGSYTGINKGTSETMRMVFNHSLPQGSYNIIVRFSDNNCQLEIDRDKLTP